MGFSVFYDCILEIEDWFVILVSEWFEEDSCICFLNLRKGLFFVVVLDNIDYNLSLIIVLLLFYGIFISIF